MSTWIFLRGLTRESRHWGCFLEQFRRELPSAQIYTPDLPGNGALHAERSPSQVEAIAEHVRAGLRAHGLSPPYYVLAMSLGAMVAVDWAARHPEDISGGILISTSLRPFSPFYHRLRPGSYLRLMKLAFGQSADASERTILELTSRHAENRAEVLSNWIAYRREYAVDQRNALCQLLAAARYRAPLVRPAIPLLVLAGRGDALVNPQCSRRIARIWNTAFAEHSTAGHDLPLDDGAWVAQQAKRWLSGFPLQTP